MIKYHVRSRDLITVINDIGAGRLILDAYFQRNLVWRDVHKQDFIKTILLGYPCPQIFISKGMIDVERMETTSCVVDGQQRLSAINSYLKGEFAVDGRKYANLTGDEKSEFLKYELAVIELDLDNNDPRVKEIFQRLNRTSNSLTAIEKLASQYAPSQYMLVASHLAGELSEFSDEEGDAQFRVDPAVDRSFFEWAAAHPAPNFVRLCSDFGVFKSYEVSRKVHLMHTLNLMTTLQVGFFNRNVKSREYLDINAERFEEKEVVVSLLERAAAKINEMNLPIGSYWFNKANVFSLVVSIANAIRGGRDVDAGELKRLLDGLEADLPEDYRAAATEGVNDSRERRVRDTHLSRLIEQASVAAA